MKRFAGFILATLWLAHAFLKAQAGLLPELLWASHLSAALLALGLILELSALSSLGFLFHIAVAAPAYALHLLAHGDTNWTSFLLHLLSPIAGWIAWQGMRLPGSTLWRAWVFYLVLVLVSRAFTPENLNINLAFKPWEVTAFLGIWPNRIANALLVLAQLGIAQWLINRRRACAHKQGAVEV